LAAATAGVKPKFIELPIRGPITDPNTVEPPDMAAHAGRAAYSAITLSTRLPDVKSPPSPTVVVDDPVEDPPPRSPLRIPKSPDVDDVDELGEARPCSDVVIEESSCESVDCTPVPVAVPAACATAADWLAVPASLVVDGGVVKAANREAAAEFAA
jgi:hypothetical protein